MLKYFDVVFLYEISERNALGEQGVLGFEGFDCTHEKRHPLRLGKEISIRSRIRSMSKSFHYFVLPLELELHVACLDQLLQTPDALARSGLDSLEDALVVIRVAFPLAPLRVDRGHVLRLCLAQFRH
jgi:hypothetical protein